MEGTRAPRAGEKGGVTMKTIRDRDAALEAFMSWEVYHDCDLEDEAKQLAQLLIRWMYDRGWIFVPEPPK